METAKFGTFTEDLEQLADRLEQPNVKHVAMASTGVYWKPVWNVLELTPRHSRVLLVFEGNGWSRSVPVLTACGRCDHARIDTAF